MTIEHDEDYEDHCRHFNDARECDLKCARCGHLCGVHPRDGKECAECDCAGWVEPRAE